MCINQISSSLRFTKTLFRKISYVMLYLPPPVFKFLLWSSRTLKYVHASDKFRVLLMSILIFMCILLLSVQRVPEKILGIRSPERVLEVFEESQNALNDTAVSPAVQNGSHLLQKRHIPHKFWARARPHNKFRKKKRLQRLKQENLDANEKLSHKANAINVRHDVIKSGNIR
ncbi:uncharacterized protein LOC135211077 isoform X1 [Macrobrachium nipponense]|uniref:uncharacterized protein LOC135211077 isoform X1 n=1 Tax=Macrobrachium nipponense TaxID=159736 RepID=UPI0030C7AA28